MPKNFYDVLKETKEEMELITEKDDMDDLGSDDEPDDMDNDEDFGDEEKPREPGISDLAPDGENKYDAEDLCEIIDMVYEILDKEDDDEENESVEEIGLDLWREYSNLLPETVINQVISDLRETFDIDDQILESFGKSKTSPAMLAAKKLMHKHYKRNKKKLVARVKAWRVSKEGKSLIRAHKQAFKFLKIKRGKKLHTPSGMPVPVR